MSSISAGTSAGTALVSTGDTTGQLVFKTNGATTAITIGTDQVVTLAQPLPVGSGGTGGAATPTAGGIVYGTGTVQAVTSAGTSGQLLQSNGASAPTWENAVGGISEWDQWRLTTNSTANDYLTTNLERNDTSFAVGGSGMTQSSGVFSFPSTGKWLVRFFHNGIGLERAYIDLSTNSGSTYAAIAQVEYVATDGAKKGGSMEAIINVTSISTFKLKFFAGLSGAGATTYGNTTVNYTYMTFIKLAS